MQTTFKVANCVRKAYNQIIFLFLLQFSDDDELKSNDIVEVCNLSQWPERKTCYVSQLNICSWNQLLAAKYLLFSCFQIRFPPSSTNKRALEINHGDYERVYEAAAWVRARVTVSDQTLDIEPANSAFSEFVFSPFLPEEVVFNTTNSINGSCSSHNLSAKAVLGRHDVSEHHPYTVQWHIYNTSTSISSLTPREVRCVQQSDSTSQAYVKGNYELYGRWIFKQFFQFSFNISQCKFMRINILVFLVLLKQFILHRVRVLFADQPVEVFLSGAYASSSDVDHQLDGIWCIGFVCENAPSDSDFVKVYALM